MKYHIDTIPLWDAMNGDNECLFCTISRHIELQKVEKYLGASLMDPSTRIEVNKAGFCQKHLKMLNDSGKNKLGLAILMESFITEQKSNILKYLYDAKNNSSYDKKALLKFERKQNNNNIEMAKKKLNNISNSCIICKTIDDTMKRYYKTFFHLWKNDNEFHTKFLYSKGLCLPHISDILESSKKSLSSKEQFQFINELYKITENSLEIELTDLKHFIKKYDYRSRELPWGNSKDSVERSVNKIEGWCIGIEPNPEDRIKNLK